MATKLLRGEYWVLELVSELSYHIDILFASNLEEALNKPGHGLDKNEIMEVFLFLVEEQLISLWQHDNEIKNPTEKFIKKYLNTPPLYEDWIRYELTNKGGEVWEDFAKPKWNRYISAWYEPSENFEEAVIECVDRGYLNSYVKSLELHELKIFKNTRSEEVLQPWDATYWKTLPEGHRLTFRCKWNEEDNSPPPPMWFENLWYRWR